jgi:hypothetical protein
MRLQRYINEGIDIGNKMEMAIVSMWNTGKLYKGLSPLTDDDVQKIVKYLKSQKIKGNARKVKNDEVSSTDLWKELSKSTEHTPKTDIAIGDTKISLKTGKAQLMSGSISHDAKACFLVAVKKSKESEEMIKKITSMIDRIPKEVKLEQGETTSDLLEKVKIQNRKMTLFMRKYFENNEKVLFEFVKEAATGKTKFVGSGGNELGKADYLLYCEPDGNTAILHDLKENNYLKKLSKQVKISISFKSNSMKKRVDGEIITVGRRSYSVFRLMTGLFNQYKKECREYQLKGNILTESILVDIWDKITNWFTKTWSEIKEWIGNSFTRLLEFLEIDDMDVEFNNHIDFS